MSRLDFTPYRRSTVGFDRLFDMLESQARLNSGDNYPPFNISKSGADNYRITLAVAGFRPQDIEITAQANKAESLDDKAKAKGALMAAAQLLGLLQQDPEAWFGLSDMDPALKANIDAMIIERTQARADKDWPKADELRDGLAALNVIVEDSPEGPTWRLKG